MRIEEVRNDLNPGNNPPINDISNIDTKRNNFESALDRRTSGLQPGWKTHLLPGNNSIIYKGGEECGLKPAST
jgi:hypothetical protein